MAYKQRMPEAWVRSDKSMEAWGHFYNLDQPVGLNCPNKRTDVLLVQLLLRSNLEGDPNAKGFPTLTIDGFFGLSVLHWILNLQLKNATTNAAAIVDGKVHPARNLLNRHGTDFYHLLLLNNGLRLRAPDTFKDMAGAASCPADLAAAVRSDRA
jgi:hypothetical protein